MRFGVIKKITVFLGLCAVAVLICASCQDQVSDDSPKWYNITFHANGGTGTMPPQAIESGKSATLTPNAFTREGYAFTGWKDKADWPDNYYDDGEKFKMGVENVTLYAVWVGNYAVTFDANGGTGTMAAQTIAYGKSAALIPNAFTRDGYTFAGWATTAEATKASYADGASFKMEYGDVILYAVWAWKAPSLATLQSEGYIAMVEIPTAASGAYVQATSATTGFAHDISPFSLGKYEVTYELWCTVSQWALSQGYEFFSYPSEGNDGVPKAIPTADAKHEPVMYVDWRECILWCNAYSQMAGKTPVYYSDAGYTMPIMCRGSASTSTTAGSINNPYVKTDANGYRLPTAGEWQYAASCGGTYPYAYASGADAKHDATTGGADIDGDGDVQYSDAVAWYGNNSGGSTHPVGTKAANKFGLYDMSGNADEWCFDWWNESLPTDPQTDYSGPTSGLYRVVSGGCWKYGTYSLQVGSKDCCDPSMDYGDGFRVCCSR